MKMVTADRSIRGGVRTRVRKTAATSFLKASPAEDNAYTVRLWALRKILDEVRSKKVCDAFEAIWKEQVTDEDTTTGRKHKGSGSRRCDDGIAGKIRDYDVFTPIMDVLPHIRLVGACTLDYKVKGDALGAHGDFMMREGDMMLPLSLALDGTAESAWECVLLRIASEQFFLGWHAGYDRYQIVTDIRKFDEEVDAPFAGARAWMMIAEEGRKRMMANDFAPSVSVSEGFARVTYYIFSAFKGLYKRVDKVDLRDGTVKRITDEVIVEYWCGVCY